MSKANEETNQVERLVMRDLDKRDKNLILHAAYYAVALHDWRDVVFRSKIDRETKLELIGKFPCGDPMNNLMNLAAKILPGFDESKTINENLKLIKAFVYGGA